MHSRNQITPFRGGQQGYIHFSDLMPKDDPYASWEVQADSGLLLPTRKIPPKRKSFSGYVPFPEHGRVVCPPPRYSLGHPFGDNPLRGANEEEGRNPAGRGSGRRP